MRFTLISMRSIAITAVVCVWLCTVGPLAFDPEDPSSTVDLGERSILWLDDRDRAARTTILVDAAVTAAGPATQAVPLIGHPWRELVPDLEVPMFGGRTFSIAEARGKVLLIDFWASWCPPCVAELPHIEQLYTEHRDEGLEVVAINYREAPDFAMAFVQSLGISLPIGMATPEVNEAFEVESMPTVILLAEGDEPGVEVGAVTHGAELLEVSWLRQSRTAIEGVVVYDDDDGSSVIATTMRDALDLFEGDGRYRRRFNGSTRFGRLRAGDIDGRAGDELFSFRPGGKIVSYFDFSSERLETWESPSPIFQLRTVPGRSEADGSGRIVLATASGLFLADPKGEELRRIEGMESVSDIVRVESGFLALEPGVRVRQFDAGLRVPDGEDPWSAVAVPENAWRLVDGGGSRAGLAGFSVSAVATGRFLGDRRTQAALALDSGRVVLVDPTTGRVEFSALWPDVKDLAAGDLDGDGCDELVERDIVDCEACPRLRAHCLEVARVRRRAFRDETYWGRPVPGFGDREARILVLGLAPAAHGANRTGRVFTGDRSGDWLYGALFRARLANQSRSEGRDDGLELSDVFVTATGRCAPPANKPTTEEMARCAPFLDREFDALSRMRLVLALGRIAWDAAIRRVARVAPGEVPRPRPAFGHGAETRLPLGPGARPVYLLGSYHPSQQNTQTGRLTRPMFDRVLRRAVMLSRDR